MTETIEVVPSLPQATRRYRYRRVRHDTPFGEVPRRKHGFVRMTGRHRLGDVTVNDQGIPRRKSGWVRMTGQHRLGDAEIQSQDNSPYRTTDQGIPRFRSPDFSRASGRVRLGDMNVPRFRSPAWSRARGRVRLGQEMTERVPRRRSIDFRRGGSQYRLGDTAPLGPVQPLVPRRKHGFVQAAGRIRVGDLGASVTEEGIPRYKSTDFRRQSGRTRLGDFAEGEDVYNSHLNHDLLPQATACRPMKRSGPACVKYSQIDTFAQAQQYARRFFHVAVKYGKLVPDRTALRQYFNKSAELYFDANRLAGLGGSTADLKAIQLDYIGKADLNMVKALRLYEAGSGHSSWKPIAEVDPDVKELYEKDLEETGPSTKPKSRFSLAGLPWWAFGLFGAAALGMYAIGKRQEDDEAEEAESASMMGISTSQLRFGRAAKGCGGHGLSAASFRACMSRSLSAPS